MSDFGASIAACTMIFPDFGMCRGAARRSLSLQVDDQYQDASSSKKPSAALSNDTWVEVIWWTRRGPRSLVECTLNSRLERWSPKHLFLSERYVPGLRQPANVVPA
jgi:hypothetical protein